MPLKLIYFAVPGRAEVIRLLFAIGNVPLEEQRIPRDEWPAYKLTTPFGQIPLLQLEDGTYLAQSLAIEKLATKLAGLNPSDPIQEARVDEAAYLFNELVELARWPNQLPTPEERVPARKALSEGALKQRLAVVEKFVAEKLSAEGNPGPYLFGENITRADVALFHWTGFVVSGFWEGFPTDLLKGHPAILKLRATVANHPAIKAFYEKEKDDLRKINQVDVTEAALKEEATA